MWSLPVLEPWVGIWPDLLKATREKCAPNPRVRGLGSNQSLTGWVYPSLSGGETVDDG